MRYKEFWIALGLGALAGGIAALLYAPQSGVQTRKKLKRSLEDAGDALEDATDYLKDQAERLSKEAQKFIDKSKGQFGEAVDSVSDGYKSAQKFAKAAARLV